MLHGNFTLPKNLQDIFLITKYLSNTRNVARIIEQSMSYFTFKITNVLCK